MLNPEHKKNPSRTKKMGEKEPRNRIRDLPPRKDVRGGGTPKSSPTPLSIPPKGFFASDQPPQ
jgi:hypothetical protein